MIEFNIVLMCILFAIIGVSIATILSLIPGLHIYSILGFVVLFLIEGSMIFDPIVFSAFTVSMLMGYCLGSCVSAVFFQTPDDSSIFMVFPSQKYLEDGRGYEAAYLTGFGAIIGAVISCLLIIFAGDYLVMIVDLITEHTLWIIATAMAFVWLSEWPKDPARQKSRIRNLAAAWVQLLMGLFVIIAAGILGIYLFFSQLVPAERAFQGLAAAFVGLFAIPSLLQTLFTGKNRIPKQNLGKSIEMNASEMTQGVAAGLIGGAIGMLVPSLTAGVGNTFARHAVAQSGDRSFMFSQGLSRSVYYIGAVLLLFIPGVVIRRGGAALFITLFYVPETQGELLIIAASVLIAAACGWLLFTLIILLITKTIHRIDTRIISAFGLIVMIILTYLMLNTAGLLVLAVATAIGYIPLAFNTRRIHCIAVITVPIMISMAGLTLYVSQLFGIA
ncbi:MAG: tripartite tricarboxylate transporter permease [Promethearchaeota archaeon]